MRRIKNRNSSSNDAVDHLGFVLPDELLEPVGVFRLQPAHQPPEHVVRAQPLLALEHRLLLAVVAAE
jgi:hypothetical protein